MAQSTRCTQTIKHKFVRHFALPAQGACNCDTSADRNLGKSRLRDRPPLYGNSCLCDHLQYICDRLRSYGNQPQVNIAVKSYQMELLKSPDNHAVFFFQKIILINCKHKSVTDLTAGEFTGHPSVI